MRARSSVLVIDPKHATRTTLAQVIHYERLVSTVKSYSSLEEALRAIRDETRADIVFVSALFPQQDLGEFIGSAKQTRNGRDGAYLIIYDASMNRADVCRGLIEGIDGFIIMPFCAEDVRDTLITADAVRRQNLRRRIETAAGVVIELLRDEIDHNSMDRFLGRDTKYSEAAMEAMRTLRYLSHEDSQIYFDVLTRNFTESFPRIPFPIRGNVAAIEKILDQLRDPNPRIRAGAAKAVGSLGARGVVAIPHLEALLNDSNKLCRVRARQALDEINAAMGFQDTPQI